MPQRLRVRAGRDVRAEARGRIEEAEALLDAQALNGVGIVGAPDLRREPEHAAVKAVAAGRAALKQDLRPGQEDTAQHVVEAEDEGVLLRAECAGMAVHVPLDVADGRGIEDAADALDEIVPHLRLCEVEQQLVSAEPDPPGRGRRAGPSRGAAG